MWWQTLGQYQYEVGSDGRYTGWYRCVGGQLADSTWPQWKE
jgi:hypothetical protein